MGTEKLKELLVQEDEVLEDMILDSLRGIVSLDSKSGEVYPTERYGKLRADAKICVYLMARRAAHLLGLVTGDAVSAKIVRERTGLPLGTANPNLRTLLGNGVIAQNEQRDYYIAAHGLARAREIIRGGEQ